MMREIGQRRKKEKEPYPFGEPWGWRVVLYRIGVGGGLFCWAMSFFLCPWHTLYSLGGNHYAAADGEGSIGYHISSGAACRCIFLGRPLLALAIILLPTGCKRPANAIWREFSGGVNSDSLIAQKFQGVSNESTGRVIQ